MYTVVNINIKADPMMRNLSDLLLTNDSMLGDRDAKTIFMAHFRIPGGDADLDMLRGIVSCYANIPYENLTKIIRKFTAERNEDRRRGPVEVVSGYIENHTGGTCFSLTFCLGSILTRAGYRCYPVMADMKRPNVHCALVVRIDGRKYIVDPGYLLGEPVELTGAVVRLTTSFGNVELRPRSATRYDLFTVTGGERKWRYRVRLNPVSQRLFMRYWQESFNLPMMNSLQLTRLTKDGHLYIRNHHLRLRRPDGKVNENIRSRLESRIETEFGIPGDITAEARELIERMKQSRRR
jgi:arylamine N-acetyltransferase